MGLMKEILIDSNFDIKRANIAIKIFDNKNKILKKNKINERHKKYLKIVDKKYG